MIEQETIKKIRNFLKETDRVVILTHANPDGDAIGSSLALALTLRKVDIQADVIIPDKVPEFLSWLPGNELISVFKDNREEVTGILERAGLLFCLDFNDPGRINGISELVNRSVAKKILVDHHQDPADFADITISEPWRASVGEMIYRLIQELFEDELIDRDIATALYTAIMTDTGSFSYGSAYPELFQIVGELLEYKIDKDQIYSNVYDSYSADRMRLMGYCIQEKMVVLPELNTAYIPVTSSELRKFNYKKGDTEGFVNIPFTIKGIRFTALFIEKRDHIKASFRSKGDFAVNEFAEKHFSGGGHKNAAGGEMKGSMEDTIRQFEKLVKLYENQLH